MRRENVPIVRIAEEGPGADEQPTLVGDDDAGLDTGFAALAGFALADALAGACRAESPFLSSMGCVRRRSARMSSGFRRTMLVAQPPLMVGSLRVTSRRTMPRIVRCRLTIRRRRLNCLAWASPPALRRHSRPSLTKVRCRGMPAWRLARPWPGRSPASNDRPDGRWPFPARRGIDDDPLELARAHRLGLYRGVDGRLEPFFDTRLTDMAVRK